MPTLDFDSWMPVNDSASIRLTRNAEGRWCWELRAEQGQTITPQGVETYTAVYAAEARRRNMAELAERESA